MSFEYELAGYFPVADPRREVMYRLSEVLGLPLDLEDPSSPEIDQEGVIVYTALPEDDEVDRKRPDLGFDLNLTVLLRPYVDDVFTSADFDRLLIRAAAGLAGLPGSRGLLFTDFGADETIVLGFDGGVMTLNQGWDGWTSTPGLADGAPRSSLMTELRFAGRA